MLGLPQCRLTDLELTRNGIVPIIYTNAKRSFANNLTIACLTDVNADGSIEITASKTVFTENLPNHRVTDLNSSPGVAITGSPNVFTG